MTERTLPSHPIRVGIIGTGFAAECHADALRRLPGVQLVGIASGTPTRARDAALALGAGRAYRDPAELIDDPEIDAVHICAINRLHAELSATALAAGKHVLTEKPLGTGTEETEVLSGLADTAAGRGTIAAVCFNYRHYPVVQQLRAMLRSGEHGSAHFVHGSYLQDWLLYEGDWNWRLDPTANGPSRAIADIGSHWLDLVQHVTGQQVTAVFADLATHHAVRHRPAVETGTFGPSTESEHEPVPVDSEDFGTVMLRFTEGTRGALVVSQVSPGRKNRLAFQLDTSETAFAWNQEHPETAWVGRRRAANLEYLRDPTQGGPRQLPAGHPEGWRDALGHLCADFYGAVDASRNGCDHESRFATFADGHRMALLVEAIMQSDRTGSWIEVGELDRVRR